MGLYTGNGQGSKVTRAEIIAFERLRDIGGMSPAAAAATIGRSKSWAYNHEQRRRIEGVAPTGEAWKPMGERPEEWPAVGLCLTLLKDDDEHKQTFFNLLERYGVELVFPLAKLTLYLAALRAEEIQHQFGDEIKGGPIDAGDVLETISFVFDQLNAGESLDGSPVLPPELDTFYREWVEYFEEVA